MKHSMNDQLFAPDYKAEPYWWERTPRPELPFQELPKEVDVLIVGSGYTGLCAAIQTARGGRSTLILDSGQVGCGCSTRNGGQISTSLKPGLADLSRKHGHDRAVSILREGHNALAWIKEFIESERIDCDLARVGRFVGAHNPTQFESLQRKISNQPAGLEVEAYPVGKNEQHQEIGTDFYHGGVVYPDHASLDPAAYHQGLLDLAMEAGADVTGNCAVLNIETGQDVHTVTTERGQISARDVIVATNGYSDKALPWHRRRIVPIGSYIIATEPLPGDLIDELAPKRRVMSDTRKLVFYYRVSPDHQRITFGGRVSVKETDPDLSAPLLHKEMVRIFPQLEKTRISRSWMGFVGYTFDTMPHVGLHNGVHYAMGYCGSGVSLASYFGARIGQQVLKLKEGQTALDGLAFPTRPFYKGDPWFLATSVRYYRWQDSLNR